MTTIKYKDIQKLSNEDRKNKLKELKLEITKAKVGSKGTNKQKIKRIIARILTFNTQQNRQEELGKK